MSLGVWAQEFGLAALFAGLGSVDFLNNAEIFRFSIPLKPDRTRPGVLS